MGNPIRSPLGAVGALLVALEAIAGGTLLALESDPGLRIALVVAMIAVLVAVTVVILGLIIHVAKTNPAYLFNPAEIGQLSAEAQIQFLTPQPPLTVSLVATPEPITVNFMGTELTIGETLDTRETDIS